ncbi:hypothetical protein [Streptomyces albogriseolus]|uniref:hypothetical protein n=1 Tax=Streptomyces albogriseolus TaxID=1887 RepID=UPI00225A23AA|nr:hypothetical protein [Streptomyces viridodiastaticus]MCX4624908.1 hypothetical protein [Streptomyces viridodiastaticus]
MTSASLTIETPAGPVHATAGPLQDDAVVFELGGAMRGSVHVTGTHHPQHWNRFTAVRACLGPVNAYQDTAPDDALPRLARGSSGYRGSLELYIDIVGRPEVSVSPLETAAGYEPSPKTAATLTAVLQACAEHVMQREDLPAILTASRQRDTPDLLRFLAWSAAHHQAEAARYEREARAARPALRAAVAAWWTAARCFIACPHPVLLLVLADYPGSLSRAVAVEQWRGPYCRTAAAREHEYTRRAQSEADSLRAQERARSRGRRPAPGSAAPQVERPYFVVGQWQGGGEVDIWHVEEAPADPDARADAHEQHASDAETAFGSVNVVYATSPQAAADRARREARRTSERIHRDLTRP